MKTVVRTDADLYHCILFQIPVDMFIEGKLAEAGVLISDFTDTVIYLDGRFVFRNELLHIQAVGYLYA
ncbi:hypothetical protein DQX05_29590 [Paenibacillus thiaminolyticus]|uniref:DUF2642 domain-containing protein n=1 Tax=Paenibacillus thiaminolyticus TaxID=49283 RepID=A0A3A3GDN9_PANTH|nr:hypothetical protein DQX05_29590 [Paenibacillus thiaminolyticus]